MRKKNNRKNYIVILIGVLVTLAVGYSIFTDVLNITGTFTSADVNFALKFVSASVNTAETVGSTGHDVEISADGKTLTLTAPNLQYPGAKVEYDVTIKNVGTLKSLLKTIVVSGNTDADITVTPTPNFVQNSTLDPEATLAFKIVVAWNTASTTGNKTVNYTVQLDYEQAP